MSRLVKWGYWCLKYFLVGEYLIRAVREYICFCLDREAGVHQVCGQAGSGLRIWRQRGRTGAGWPVLEPREAAPRYPRTQPAPLCPVPALGCGQPRRGAAGAGCSAGRTAACGMLLWGARSRWESCSYPEIRHATDNGSPSSSRSPVKGNPVSE